MFLVFIVRTAVKNHASSFLPGASAQQEVEMDRWRNVLLLLESGQPLCDANHSHFQTAASRIGLERGGPEASFFALAFSNSRKVWR